MHLDNFYVREWLVTPFDVKIDNKGYECDLEDELIGMHVDLKVKAFFKSKYLSEYWSNINTASKYTKLKAATELFLLAFPTSYMVEAGFSHVNVILAKQTNSLNMLNLGELRLRLTNFHRNINNLAAVHEAHSSD